MFQDSPGPLIQDTPTNYSQAQHFQQPSQSLVHKGRFDAKLQAFSLNDLAPTSIKPRAIQYNPPTPPSDQDGSETMDWTPSQQPLPLASKYRIPAMRTVQPSPFYGHLPPAPVSQAHKLRNPPSQPTFRQASTPQKQSFFQRSSAYLDQDDVSDLASEAGSVVTNKSRYDSPQFNPPRFFPNADYSRDTGLESIFSNTFSLAEEPHEIRMTERFQQSNQLQQNRKTKLSSKVQEIRPLLKIQTLWVVLLSISCLAWYQPSSISHLATRFRLTSLGVAAIVAGKGLFQMVKIEKVSWSWSNLFIYGFELCAAMYFSSLAESPASRIENSQLRAMVLGLLGAMVLQEVWVLLSGSPSTNIISDRDTYPIQDQNSLDLQPSHQPTLNGTTPISSLRTERKPNSIAVSERTTRSKSKLEKSPDTAVMRRNLSPSSEIATMSRSRRIPEPKNPKRTPSRAKFES